MDRRREARFQVYAAAKVAPLDEPDRETEGQVVDISGFGLRLITTVEFHEDDIIVIETDQHLILADVRNCEMRGNRFGVGAERIHSAVKPLVSPTSSLVERNQALVEAYHHRLREELPDTSEPVAEGRPARRIEIAGLAPEPSLAVAIATRLSPQKPVEVKQDSLQNLVFAVKPQAVPSRVSPVHAEVKAESTAGSILIEEPPVTEIAPADTGADIPPEPPMQTEPSASEDAVRSYFSPPPFDTSEPAAASRGKRVAVAVVCMVLAVVVILLGPLAKRLLFPAHPAPASSMAKANPSKPASAANSSKPPVQKPAASASTAPAVQKPAPSTPASSKPAASPVTESRVLITTNDRSWVTACSDGKVVINKLFVSGNSEDLEFTERAIVRVGNAGAVQVQLNGKSIGPTGRPGQLRAISITADSWSFLKLHDPDGCTQ
jgi:RodZ C-terminal domain